MPVVLLVAVLARLVLGALSRGAQGDGAQARKSTVPTSVSFAVLVWAIVPLKCVFWVTAIHGGEVGALPWLMGGLLVLFPWALAHRVLVPLGLWRSAYVVTHLSCWVWRGDTRGGALLAGVWALAHGRGRVSPKATAWLLARREACKPTRGGSILASALLSEIRDDRDGMLALTRSVLLLADDPRHQAARALAAQWLAAEAVARGDWSEAASVTVG
ncbi:MAG: hypothetical protein JKY37_31025, partial [Nannocystaceae bacterium]|nr:hypothetical protein [Nannocystaceae bacterium]